MLVPNGTMIAIGFLLIIVGLVYLGMYLFSVCRAGYNISRIEKEGKLESVLQDFANAKPMLHDKLYLGENYMFGQGSGRIVRYDEVWQIYQYVHSTNHIEDKRRLKVKLNTGKVFTLCELKRWNEEAVQLKDAVTLIYIHNPKIQIGYH